MQIIAYLLVLLAILAGYYEILGPGPGPSEFIDDLEWWRPAGYAHAWPVFAPLERLAQGGGTGALVPLGLFWAPAIAMLVWGFRLSGSALLRVAVSASFVVLLVLPYYGYMAPRVWRFFEWRSVAVAGVFALVVAAVIFAPSLLRSALARSRVLVAIALTAVFAGVFLLSTEITGTDSSMRLNISPWPVVTLFGLLLVGSVLAGLHVAAGAGTWLGARVGGPGGLGAAAAVGGVVGAAISWWTLGAPGGAALTATAAIGAAYALVRSWQTRSDPANGMRLGAITVAAGVFALAAIQISNRAAIAFQTRARNETATRVLVALEAYRETEGAYPRKLEVLVPEPFSQVPRPRIGLIEHEDDEFTYTNLGDSYVLEFSSVQWVQCGYSPPYDVARYSDEDVDVYDEDLENDAFHNPFDDDFDDEGDSEDGSGGDFDDESTAGVSGGTGGDPQLQALLADFGLEGAWNCQDAPPKLW